MNQKHGEADVMTMSESELLVQRFVDHDLSGDERVRFLARLGSDEDLRQRLLDVEQLIVEAGRVPDPAVPAEFVYRVMSKTSTTEPARSHAPEGGWRRWTAALLEPRTLRWNMATAFACTVVLVTAAAAFTWRARQASPDITRTLSAPTPAASTVLVRLVVVQPAASTVHVAGDFNGWNPSRTPLQSAPGGAWSVTIPLAPGRYEYMFIVDNAQWVADPFATEQTDDGFGSTNAVLDVRGEVASDTIQRSTLKETS